MVVLISDPDGGLASVVDSLYFPSISGEASSVLGTFYAYLTNVLLGQPEFVPRKAFLRTLLRT